MEVVLSETDRVPNTSYRCVACGAEAILYVVNAGILATRPQAAGEDRWFSCADDRCPNHEGEAHFQDLPDWVTYDK